MAFCYHQPRHEDGNYCIYPAQMRAWEAKEIKEIPGRGHELMEIAGREVAQYVLEHYPTIHDVLIFCGPGNNGGDALVAARYLERCGLGIHLFVFDDCVVRTPDALSMFDQVRHLTRTVLRDSSDVSKVLEWERRKDLLVIDGIFGTGYHPTHSQLMTRVYQCIERLSCPVVSIDIPSGIDGTTGYRGPLEDEMPPRAIQATDTITFGAPKAGHFLGDGPSHCGQLTCVDIGLRPCPVPGHRSLILTDSYCDSHYWCEFERQPDIHKGRCGHVVVIGGAENMPGAPSLSAFAALRAGCGLVTLAARHRIQTRDEIMVCELEKSPLTLDDDVFNAMLNKADCIVVGPGLGRDQLSLDIVRKCTDFKGRIVLDADALWALSELKDVSFKKGECFVTPHPMEAARLCGVTPREILFAPIHFAEQICKTYGVTTILKSHATVIANIRAGNLRTAILPYPNPAMATAGAGDVLAGITGGILAQARSGAITHWFDAFEVAAIAVHAHSRAGRKAASARGNAMCASDIVDYL